MYQKINTNINNKINNILKGEYEISTLGTIDKNSFPFVSKIIPMFENNILYILISDLSEHTQNINMNDKVSFYFSLKEKSKTKSNNPRLTITGNIKKLSIDKDSNEFIKLLNSYQEIEKGSKMWGMFSDFNFYEFNPVRALYIEGFGKAYQKKY
jgi:putative heme iron utilization protein|tara:strand:- start:1505 stop:1966 length:462 start_codon:yes stop_codon:yes gene_type:complete